MIYDQHIHSSFSKDSHEDIEKYFELASKNGIKYVVTCEHFDPHTTVDDSTWIADYDALIEKHKELKKKYPNVTPLLGLELGYRQDYLHEGVELANKYPFDLIQFSLHDNGVWDYYYWDFYKEDAIGSLNGYFDLMYQGMTEYKNYDVLSHIDFAYKAALHYNPDLKFNIFEDKVIRIMKLLIEEGKAFEINTKVQETIDDDNHVRYLLNLYKSLGGYKLTLSSDAHSVERYNSSFPRYIKIIKECGFSELRYYVKRKEYTFTI